MLQEVGFTAWLQIDTEEGLNFEVAAALVRRVLAVGDKHQDYTLGLERVHALSIVEGE